MSQSPNEEYREVKKREPHLVETRLAEKYHAVLDKLATLREGIEARYNPANLRHPDWGHVGDLGHLDCELAELVKFISNNS